MLRTGFTKRGMPDRFQTQLSSLISSSLLIARIVITVNWYPEQWLSQQQRATPLEDIAIRDDLRYQLWRVPNGTLYNDCFIACYYSGDTVVGCKEDITKTRAAHWLRSHPIGGDGGGDAARMDQFVSDALRLDDHANHPVGQRVNNAKTRHTERIDRATQERRKRENLRKARETNGHNNYRSIIPNSW